MLDIKRIRADRDAVLKALEKRHGNFPIEDLLKLDEKRRAILAEMESKKAKQNAVSKEVPKIKKEGGDVETIFAEMKKLSEEAKSLEVQVREIDEKIQEVLLAIPNTPHESVRDGKDDSDNTEIRKFMEPTHFDFEPKAHWDIGKDLDILDFECAGKLSGSRFALFKGLGSRLERAIASFMLDTHTSESGFTEVSPPCIVNRTSMIGTGQLPKFEFDMFALEDREMFLIPTAEVPVTNIYRDEIIPADRLPIYLTAYTPCFRKEAGSAGRDTRGLIRNHQFDKVELVKFAKPENSYEELESLTNAAEKILQLLKIPYRVVALCSGDLGFSSAKTYDLEVWMPSYGRYVEISSCSNFEDFQARRANIRYRNEDGKLDFVHTLNGSGLAVGRTFAAILENYQNEDGSVTIPEVLRPYMMCLEKIKAPRK